MEGALEGLRSDYEGRGKGELFEALLAAVGDTLEGEDEEEIQAELARLFEALSDG